jgi:uncharacterized membrane protein YfbV (UPF0208 family)
MPCRVLARLVVYLVLAVASFPFGIPLQGVFFLGSSAIAQNLGSCDENEDPIHNIVIKSSNE